MIIYLIILLSSVCVYFDAKKIGARKGLIPGFFNLGPVAWMMACLLLWIIGFPAYLVMRSRIIEAAGQQTGISKRDTGDGFRQSGLNTVSKIIAIGWTLLLALFFITGLGELSKIAPTSGNEYETAGYAIGATLGFSMYFILWAVVAVPATIIYFVSKKSGHMVIIEQQQSNATTDKTKKCPFCAETIKAEALLCRFCKKELGHKTPPSEPTPVVEQKPERPKTDWMARGKKHLKNEEVKEAISAYTMAIKDNAGGDALYWRAVAYSKIKDRRRMLDDLEASAGLGHLKAKENLAKIMAKAQ